MQYRVDERTGNKLSVLGFGCMRFPRNIGVTDLKKSEKLILDAVAAGVNYFDTAYLYPGSEATFGKIMENNGLRDQVYIATKLPIGSCAKTEDFDRFFDIQLERLKTGVIDYYLMHNINTLAQWQALCDLGIEDWIHRQKADGKIKQIGFSFHGSGAEFSKVLDAYDWEFCQIQYNYSDENHQAGIAGLKKAAEKKMPVIIMEPLLGGKLATGLPKQAEAVFKKVNPDITPAAWGLRWLLNQPEVTVILSGMSNDAQVADNLKTARNASPGMLTEEEKQAYADVVEIFKKTYKVPCTGCAYCMPCPHNINIPGCFASYNASHALGRITGLIQYTTSTGANREADHMASRCTACGKCVAHCPQHIGIPTALKDVAKRMEPFYYRAAMSVMRSRAK